MVEARGNIAIAESVTDSKPTINTHPTLGPIASNGFVDNSRAALRRLSVLALTKPEPQTEAIKEYHPGATVLIPIHTDERLSSIEHTLRSLSNQGEKTKDLSIVIADNGISNEGRYHIEEVARQNGLTHLSFADAKPTSPEHKNAAHARNKALELIKQLATQHPEYRQDGILMLDSDTVLLPRAVEELEKTYRKRQGTVAVTSRNIAVPNIDSDTQATYFREVDSSSSQERALPKLYEQGKHVDVLSIVAFGSDVATKTCGIFIDKRTINRLSKPFVVMPKGSSEDMLLTVALNNMGNVWHNPRAVVLDQARQSPEQTKKQRKNWGEDHVILFADLVSMGLTSKGLYVLEPKGETWVEWKVPHSDPITGLIINPSQLKDLSLRLKKDINDGFLDLGSPDTLEEGIRILERITRHIDLTRNQTLQKIRTDLPEPIEPNPAQTRFSPEALTGLLAGNILGMHEIQKIDKETIPQIVFFGVRQAANWK